MTLAILDGQMPSLVAQDHDIGQGEELQDEQSPEEGLRAEVLACPNGLDAEASTVSVQITHHRGQGHLPWQLAARGRLFNVK